MPRNVTIEIVDAETTNHVPHTTCDTAEEALRFIMTTTSRYINVAIGKNVSKTSLATDIDEALNSKGATIAQKNADYVIRLIQ